MRYEKSLRLQHSPATVRESAAGIGTENQQTMYKPAGTKSKKTSENNHMLQPWPCILVPAKRYVSRQLQCCIVNIPYCVEGLPRQG